MEVEEVSQWSQCLWSSHQVGASIYQPVWGLLSHHSQYKAGSEHSPSHLSTSQYQGNLRWELGVQHQILDQTWHLGQCMISVVRKCILEDKCWSFNYVRNKLINQEHRDRANIPGVLMRVNILLPAGREKEIMRVRSRRTGEHAQTRQGETFQTLHWEDNM